MKTASKMLLEIGILLGIICLAAATSASAWNWQETQVFLARNTSKEAAKSMIADWPEYSKLAAKAMLEKYGPPDEIRPVLLAWSRNGQWLRTLVYKAALEPVSARDILEQSVRYDVPQMKWPALSGLGHGVTYDQVGRKLIVRSASEETNFLVMNLAVEIVQGKRSPAAAWNLCEKILRLQAAGKESPLSQRLLFMPPPATPSRWPFRLRLDSDPMLRNPLWSNEPS